MGDSFGLERSTSSGPGSEHLFLLGHSGDAASDMVGGEGLAEESDRTSRAGGGAVGLQAVVVGVARGSFGSWDGGLEDLRPLTEVKVDAKESMVLSRRPKGAEAKACICNTVDMVWQCRPSTCGAVKCN